MRRYFFRGELLNFGGVDTQTNPFRKEHPPNTYPVPIIALGIHYQKKSYTYSYTYRLSNFGYPFLSLLNFPGRQFSLPTSLSTNFSPTITVTGCFLTSCRKDNTLQIPIWMANRGSDV